MTSIVSARIGLHPFAADQIGLAHEMAGLSVTSLSPCAAAAPVREDGIARLHWWNIVHPAQRNARHAFLGGSAEHGLHHDQPESRRQRAGRRGQGHDVGRQGLTGAESAWRSDTG